ncbi:MAG: hypothetical protein HYY17_05920 [Planctomycetes bacterium]|nr:hypothetical protein [Planctomycetota bacterium]
MDHLTCDRCGAGLLLDAPVRYEVRVEVKAAYDPMEITDEDLAKDHAAEMKRILAELEGLSAEEAQDQVYREFRFDLCASCRKPYMKNPLAKP